MSRGDENLLFSNKTQPIFMEFYLGDFLVNFDVLESNFEHVVFELFLYKYKE